MHLSIEPFLTTVTLLLTSHVNIPRGWSCTRAFFTDFLTSSSLRLMQGLTVRPGDRTRKPDPLLRVFVHCSSGFQSPTSIGPFPQCPLCSPATFTSHCVLTPHFAGGGCPVTFFGCVSAMLSSFRVEETGDPRVRTSQGPLLLWVSLGFHCD